MTRDINIKSSALVKHRTYTDKSDKNAGSSLFLELVYRVWYMDGSIERVHIPKIELPFSINHPPAITNDIWRTLDEFNDIWYIETEEKIPIHPVGNMNYRVADKNGKEYEVADTTTIITIKEKEADPVEMTIEQIERELGKKIKIVKEKEEG